LAVDVQAARRRGRDPAEAKLTKQDEQPALTRQGGAAIGLRETLRGLPVGGPNASQIGPGPVGGLAERLSGSEVVVGRSLAVKSASGDPRQQLSGEESALHAHADE